LRLRAVAPASRRVRPYPFPELRPELLVAPIHQ